MQELSFKYNTHRRQWDSKILKGIIAKKVSIPVEVGYVIS